VSGPLLSAPLLGGRVLELAPEPHGRSWRLTVTQVDGKDCRQVTVTDARPYGRIRKRAETDKMGVAQWVPLSASVRAAILVVLDRNPVIGEAPLFPAPRRQGRSWTRHHAKDLLERAEEAAGLEPLEGSDFHAYRRAWGTASKHLPLKDVAEAGGWRSTETLLRCDTQADEATMLAVVSETRKVRAAGAKP